MESGSTGTLRARIRGTLGDTDPLNKVPVKRATSRVKKGPLQGVSLILLRSPWRSVCMEGFGLRLLGIGDFRGLGLGLRVSGVRSRIQGFGV